MADIERVGDGNDGVVASPDEITALIERYNRGGGFVTAGSTEGEVTDGAYPGELQRVPGLSSLDVFGVSVDNVPITGYDLDPTDDDTSGDCYWNGSHIESEDTAKLALMDVGVEAFLVPETWTPPLV